MDITPMSKLAVANECPNIYYCCGHVISLAPVRRLQSSSQYSGP
jgi:hypothetical protein